MANISEINGYGIYAQTASLAVSSSYALTASFALNGGGGGGINDQLIALSGSNVTTTSATLVDITGFATPTLSANSGY
jgi:hypothetical protein